jgi:hypothetical protein
LLIATLLLVLPVAASAHAILVETQPAAGGTAPTVTVDFRLRYNSRVDRGRSRLTLTRPDHSQAVLPIDVDGPPDVVTAHADLPAGAYTLRWQVLAIDGHITRGDVPFLVVPAGGAK